MEWQLRNWLYFTWLSGDHIVEQHVHNLDVANWIAGSHPARCLGMGGRQVRTGPEYGHIFDHFAIEYVYPNGVTVTSMCRQIDGCASRVEERFQFERGGSQTTSGSARLTGATPWEFKGEQTNPYVQEHIDLYAAIRSGKPINEGQRIAESTLTAIMGRLSAYTGKDVSWDQALTSKLDLAPPSYSMGDLPVPEVAVPGKTPLI
jgi:predicted dehydrogenase